MSTTRKMRVAIKADEWLEQEAQMITQMIASWEQIGLKRDELTCSLSTPGLCPEAVLITNKCINDISLVLDELWKDIQETQTRHMKNIKRIYTTVKAIKN